MNTVAYDFANRVILQFEALDFGVLNNGVWTAAFTASSVKVCNYELTLAPASESSSSSWTYKLYINGKNPGALEDLQKNCEFARISKVEINDEEMDDGRIWKDEHLEIIQRLICAHPHVSMMDCLPEGYIHTAMDILKRIDATRTLSNLSLWYLSPECVDIASQQLATGHLMEFSNYGSWPDTLRPHIVSHATTQRKLNLFLDKVDFPLFTIFFERFLRSDLDRWSTIKGYSLFSFEDICAVRPDLQADVGEDDITWRFEEDNVVHELFAVVTELEDQDDKLWTSFDLQLRDKIQMDKFINPFNDGAPFIPQYNQSELSEF